MRQVRTGLLVSEDGAVPLLAESFDGNREDASSVEPALARLDALRAAVAHHDQPPLVVGDSKLLSAGNVRAFERRGLRFIRPHRKDAPMKQRLAALDEAAFAPLAYRAVWGAEIRFSCREAVFMDHSAESISSLDTV